MSDATYLLYEMAIDAFQSAAGDTASGPPPEDLQQRLEAMLTKRLETTPTIDTATALWMLDSHIKNLKTAASAVQAAIDQLRIDDIRKNGAVRLGDQAFVIGPDNTRKLLVPIEDFLEFLSIQGWPLDQVFSLSERNVRITAFRSWAERTYREHVEADTEEHVQIVDHDGDVIAERRTLLDPEKVDALVAEYVQTIEDTFFEKVEKDSADGRWVLKTLPLKQAKWAETLGHGQRRPPKTPKGS